MNQIITLVVIIHLFAAMMLSPAKAQEEPANLAMQIAQEVVRGGPVPVGWITRLCDNRTLILAMVTGGTSAYASRSAYLVRFTGRFGTIAAVISGALGTLGIAIADDSSEDLCQMVSDAE